MNSRDFEEIIIPRGLESENGVFGFKCDVYLCIVKILDWQIVRKV
jgi:hypothetical protein